MAFCVAPSSRLVGPSGHLASPMICICWSSGKSDESVAPCLTPMYDDSPQHLIDLQRGRMRPKVYEAARLGNFDYLKALISENEEDLFCQRTPKENNILHVAAQYKQVNIIEGLLQCPSGPSLLWQGNCNGDTPLHVAAKVGSQRAVQVFTDLAKSLDRVVEKGQVGACKELLRKTNSQKDTALHYAVRGGHHWVVKLLIEEDPQLCNITNAADESPLYLAASRGLPGTTELILGSTSPSSSHMGPKGLTALHTAMDHYPTGWWKIAEERPELIRARDDMGWTPLHYVSRIGKAKEVQLLLQLDTSVAYDLDKEGQSALHIAAFQGHVNVIDKLVKSCPDACDIKNYKGQTALHAAVIGGKIKAVKHMLKMPNVEDLINERDTDGNTALHLAALHKQYNIISVLARVKGVDLMATNKDHLTALDIFSARKEDGYGAAKVRHFLDKSHGMAFNQGQVKEDVKKRLDQQYVESQPAASIITGSNAAIPENFDSSKSIIDLQVLVAILIATVTFTASFTMPGGYHQDGPDKGMAVHAGRASFQAFVIFNVIAFAFSVMALFLQFDTCIRSNRLQVRYIKVASYSMYIAILGMVLAFSCGTYVVLSKDTGLRLSPYMVAGCIVAAYVIGGFLDPEAPFWWLSSSVSPRRHVRNLLFDYEMRLRSACERMLGTIRKGIQAWQDK